MKMECSFEETITNQDKSFTRSKCINRAEILIIDDPCYGLCHRCAYKKLQAENEQLKEEQKKAHSCKGCGELVYYKFYCKRCNRNWES